MWGLMPGDGPPLSGGGAKKKSPETAKPAFYWRDDWTVRKKWQTCGPNHKKTKRQKT